jgi:hypothetical protein
LWFQTSVLISLEAGQQQLHLLKAVANTPGFLICINCRRLSRGLSSEASSPEWTIARY